MIYCLLFYLSFMFNKIGEQLDYGEDICGLVLSIRPKTDTINISFFNFIIIIK